MAQSSTTAPRSPRVVVIGAGPAGLTAAYALTAAGVRPVVLEADDVVGGIARTVERDGWRFDIGGHRFFTKVRRVEALWTEMLPSENWLERPRSSRIFYQGKYFDYPLRAGNALVNLGPIEAVRCLWSYVQVRLRPPADQSHFEGWVAARFGWRLYRTFFKTYTEKVWGVPTTELRADWAAQRIQNLSLGRAVLHALTPRRRRSDEVRSLIAAFQYPRLGPGMLWEACRDRIVENGATIEMSSAVRTIRRDGDGVTGVVWSREGVDVEVPADHVVSSMPIGELVLAFEPPAPPDVCTAAKALRHRDFLTVALVVPASKGFPDNWIYVHSPDVQVGRIQNFGEWSPEMVKPGTTCLGMEYFVTQGDQMWAATDAELVELATRELATLGFASPDDVLLGHVIRMPKAYPTYDDGYAENIEVIRAWLAEAVPNVHPVGRNGMHRYNNQDHSMLTALLAVENLLDDAGHDVWAVNVEDEYHEVVVDGAVPTGTGRMAPVLPSRPPSTE